MANLTIHNVRFVEVGGHDHDDFCTLKFDVMTKGEHEEAVWERIDFFFNTTAERKLFIEAISEAGI